MKNYFLRSMRKTFAPFSVKEIFEQGFLADLPAGRQIFANYTQISEEKIHYGTMASRHH